MNISELAMSLIRSPFLIRLTDRSFLNLIGTAIAAIGAAIAVWQTEGVPVSDKVNITIAAIAAIGVVITAWNNGMQQKDAKIGQAAIDALAKQASDKVLEMAPSVSEIPVLGSRIDLSEDEILEKAIQIVSKRKAENG